MSTATPRQSRTSPGALLNPGRARARLHRDWAHPCRIGAGTGLTPVTSAPGLARAGELTALGLAKTRKVTVRAKVRAFSPTALPTGNSGLSGRRVGFRRISGRPESRCASFLFCLFVYSFVCRQISSLLYRMRGPHFVSLFDALPDALSELKRKLQVGFPLADARLSADARLPAVVH